MTEKTCTKCGETKPLDSFHKTPHLSSGRRSDCKECVKLRRPYEQAGRLRSSRAYRMKYPERAKRWVQECNARIKAEVQAAYGAKCACCGETTPEFLTIDHIYNDGAAERKKGLSGAQLYRRLKRLGFPKDRYQLLCWNCNCAEGKFGECPHKKGGSGDN